MIDTALKATRGRTEYATARRALASPIAEACRHLTKDTQALADALARVQTLEQLREEYAKGIAHAIEYATSPLGELLGCTQSCRLFDSAPDIKLSPVARMHCADLLVRQGFYRACSIIEPIVEIEKHYSTRAHAERKLKAERQELRTQARRLKRYGFRLDAAGSLEELP
jgi:hypothetical protein